MEEKTVHSRIEKMEDFAFVVARRFVREIRTKCKYTHSTSGGFGGRSSSNRSPRSPDVCSHIRLDIDFLKFVICLGEDEVGKHEVPLQLLFSSICKLISDPRSVTSISQASFPSVLVKIVQSLFYYSCKDTPASPSFMIKEDVDGQERALQEKGRLVAHQCTDLLQKLLSFPYIVEELMSHDGLLMLWQLVCVEEEEDRESFEDIEPSRLERPTLSSLPLTRSSSQDILTPRSYLGQNRESLIQSLHVLLHHHCTRNLINYVHSKKIFSILLAGIAPKPPSEGGPTLSMPLIPNRKTQLPQYSSYLLPLPPQATVSVCRLMHQALLSSTTNASSDLWFLDFRQAQVFFVIIVFVFVFFQPFFKKKKMKYTFFFRFLKICSIGIPLLSRFALNP